MKYSETLNKFLAENRKFTPQEKADEVAKLETDTLFDLLRNAEERISRYDEEVTKAIARTLFDRKIYFF